MIKSLVILTFLTLNLAFIGNTWGKVAPLIKCLGKEELRIHLRKVKGPVYLLNQTLINLVAEANDIQLNKNEYAKICQNKKYPPSVALLKAILLRGSAVFKLNKTDFKKYIQQKSVVEKINEKKSQIFFKYLSNIQSEVKDPHCLEREIPELKYFFLKFKYLEVEVSASKILEDKEKIKRIFKKIRRLRIILKKCQS